MAKKCRTCNEIVMQPRCPYQGRAFYHDRPYCVDWSKRETPLLVDALEEALGICLPHVHFGATKAIVAAQAALIRYQNEVRDAHD